MTSPKIQKVMEKWVFQLFQPSEHKLVIEELLSLWDIVKVKQFHARKKKHDLPEKH